MIYVSKIWPKMFRILVYSQFPCPLHATRIEDRSEGTPRAGTGCTEEEDYEECWGVLLPKESTEV